jgi:hypothetical protein
MGFCCQTAPAQLPGNLKIPKVSKPKPKPTPTEIAQPSSSGEPQPAPSNEPRPAAQPQPVTVPPRATAGDTTLVKTRIQFWPETLTSYKGEYNDVWSWIPNVKFITEGPELPSGGQYYVEVTQPGGAPWVKLKCENISDGGPDFKCGNSNDLEKEGTLATGVFPFTIKMRNPLEGTDKTLFTGRAKVEKVLSSGNLRPNSKQFVYYTNQDWNLPIGQVYIDNETLNVRFWLRGETVGVEAHLFYRGAEVGRFESSGYQYGASRCSPDIEYQPTRDAGAGAPQGAKWARMNCPFETVRTKPNPNNSDWHIISANPGEYEVKVLRNKRLARVLKFSVGPDGNIVDNGIASGNGMAWSNLIFVPVQVVGDLDGAWDRNAWKTEAFYGHPLTGFAWPPQ